ncbi:MAG: regulatory protein RecX, partial [Bacteroidales bacterium]
MAKKTAQPELSLDDIRLSIARYCSKMERCKSDVMKKLSSLPLSAEEKASIVQYLENEGYIDEKRFAKAFASDKLRFDGWGKLKIKYSLLKKGIGETLIDETLNELDEDVYVQKLTEELDKKLKTLPTNLDPYTRYMKLFQFGFQRGFE